MRNTNTINLRKGTFTYNHRYLGEVTVKHLLNFNDGENVRLEITEGEDKGTSFCARVEEIAA